MATKLQPAFPTFELHWKSSFANWFWRLLVVSSVIYKSHSRNQVQEAAQKEHSSPAHTDIGNVRVTSSLPVALGQTRGPIIWASSVVAHDLQQTRCSCLETQQEIQRPTKAVCGECCALCCVTGHTMYSQQLSSSPLTQWSLWFSLLVTKGSLGQMGTRQHLELWRCQHELTSSYPPHSSSHISNWSVHTSAT